MQRERFLVKSYGDNEEGTRIGLGKLFQISGTHKSSVIVVPSLKVVKGTMLTAVLGEQHSDRLIKDRLIALPNGSTVELCSSATLKNYTRADAYLALWGSEDVVEDIEALPRWTSHILVTWTPADAEKWVQAHKVQVLYDDGKE